VWALRAQTDKAEYSQQMRRVLEATPNLSIREGMAVGLDVGPNDELLGVRTFFGITFRCRAAVLTTGTFMNGRIWVGRTSMPAGRCALEWRGPDEGWSASDEDPIALSRQPGLQRWGAMVATAPRQERARQLRGCSCHQAGCKWRSAAVAGSTARRL
jgi:Glucose inhibited division protein A